MEQAINSHELSFTKMMRLDQMKSRLENKVNWVSGKATKSRELVYKLIDINKEIDSNGKTFRVGNKVYFVRELG